MPSDMPLYLVPVENRLLSLLPTPEYEKLLPYFETVSLQFGQIIYEPGDKIEYAYFPNDTIISLLTLAGGRQALEVGIIGREGVMDAGLMFGVHEISMRVISQAAGTALRIRAPVFQRALDTYPAFKKIIFLYTHSLLLQIAQTATCNRFHVIEARLARWLLMSRDRTQSNQLRLTHEFLSRMLGVRRVGVTRAADALNQKKIIEYSRGNIKILNGQGLEEAACVCYKIIKNAHEKALQLAEHTIAVE
jgi:CRP-like cAMP-binding protein